MGTFGMVHYRDGEPILEVESPNILFEPFMNHMLEVALLGGAAASGTRGVGLIDQVGFTGIASTDTAASHPGWSEILEVHDYDKGLNQRVAPIWGAFNFSSVDDSDNRLYEVAIRHPGSIQPNMAAFVGRHASVRGFFLSTENVLGSTSGWLIAATALNTPVEAFPGDYFYIRYQIDFYTQTDRLA